MLRMKCHSLSLEKHNKSISKWHLLTLLNWWNMQESVLLHNVAVHPSMRVLYEKCPMLTAVMMYVVFSYKRREVLTQNPKLNSRLLTQTMIQWPGCWRSTQNWMQWTMKNSQTVLREVCSWWFEKKVTWTTEWFLPVHSWDRDPLQARKIVLSDMERQHMRRR